MKYSKKQIKKAYLEWETIERLQPSNVMSDDEVKEYDVKEIAEMKANQLIKLMNK